MTIRSQIVVGYLATLLSTVAIAVIAIRALDGAVEAKNVVIEVDARQVSDTYRLIGTVHERASNSRAYLLTREESARSGRPEEDARIEELLVSLESRAVETTGRGLLRQARAARDEWVAASANVERRVVQGTSPARIAALFAQYPRPKLAHLHAVLTRVAEHYDQRAATSSRRSDERARDATTLVLQLGLLAGLLSLGIGAWSTTRISRRLTRLALTVDGAATEVLAGTTQQAAGSAQQAAAVQQTVATVEQLVRAAQTSADRAQALAGEAQRASQSAQDGTAAVAASAARMQAVSDQVDSTTRSVVELADRAQAISDIVTAVEEIAGQTHMLAINAAIEAARAGEDGRGFSVVASEVRSLAGQSRRATARVANILEEIEQGTGAAVRASEEGSKRAAEGLLETDRAGRTIRELAHNVESAAEAGEQIASASVQQAMVTGQIGEAMRDIEQVMDDNRASAGEAVKAARDLHSVAVELKELVGARRDER